MKKIVTALCSAALALAMPMAAFADGSAEQGSVYGEVPGVEDNGKTTFDFTDQAYEEIINNIVIDGADNVTVSTEIDLADYDEDAIIDYYEQLEQVGLDGGNFMFSVEINGEVTGDKAIVTFQLDKDTYGNKVITYYVLHETPDADGNYIQKKVVRVHADGTVTIHMDRFSIVTFMDVDGIAKYENLVEPQDGDLLSPKTGIC